MPFSLRVVNRALLIFVYLLPAEVFSQGAPLQWATYYGGSASEYSNAVVTDVSGNVYLGGTTVSPSGIASPGSWQTSYGGGANDAYLVKFDPSGNRLWATYYGGTADEECYALAVDGAGNIYMAGYTGSSGGIASGGFQNTFGGGYDAFLVKFNSAGTPLWSSYYGGTGAEYGCALSIDASDNIYLGGRTYSPSGIASGGSQNTFGGGLWDAFLVKFSSSGTRLWGTYYGGLGDDMGYGVAVDGVSGSVYLDGWTSSTANIASAGFQNTFGGGSWDAFLVKFSSSGTRIWGTYYGKTFDDEGFSACTDLSGNVYMGGDTYSTSGIASGGSQSTFGGGLYDAFLVKFDSGGNRLWGTYYGGTGSEENFGVVTDPAGNVYLSGDSYSANNIASAGYQNTRIGTENPFVAVFNASGVRQCATYYGQAHDEGGHTALDASGNVYLSGYTPGTTGIATAGAFQTTYGGGLYDAFLVKLSACGTLPLTLLSFSGQGRGGVNSLQWETAGEEDNDYFAVEKSVDGKNFETIGKVNGSGNSTARHSYSFTDYLTSFSSPDGDGSRSGDLYYRLRQVDFNGNYNFSRVITVSNERIFLSPRVFPNPVNKLLSLEFYSAEADLFDLSVSDFTGSVMIHEKVRSVKGLNCVHVITASLDPGLFVISLSGGRSACNSIFSKE